MQTDRKQRDFLSVLGYNYLKKNKLEKAIIVYKALVLLYPKSSQYAFSLSYLYHQTEQYEKALHYADVFLKSNPTKKLSLGYYLKARTLQKLGQDDKAKYVASLFLDERKKGN